MVIERCQLGKKINILVVETMIFKYDQIFSSMLVTGVYGRNIQEIINDCTDDMLKVDMITRPSLYFD